MPALHLSTPILYDSSGEEFRSVSKERIALPPKIGSGLYPEIPAHSERDNLRKVPLSGFLAPMCRTGSGVAIRWRVIGAGDTVVG